MGNVFNIGWDGTLYTCGGGNYFGMQFGIVFSTPVVVSKIIMRFHYHKGQIDNTGGLAMAVTDFTNNATFSPIVDFAHMVNGDNQQAVFTAPTSLPLSTLVITLISANSVNPITTDGTAILIGADLYGTAVKAPC